MLLKKAANPYRYLLVCPSICLSVSLVASKTRQGLQASESRSILHAKIKKREKKNSPWSCFFHGDSFLDSVINTVGINCRLFSAQVALPCVSWGEIKHARAYISERLIQSAVSLIDRIMLLLYFPVKCKRLVLTHLRFDLRCAIPRFDFSLLVYSCKN